MPKTNKIKGESFTYAFKRINDSLEAGYFLEAITLAESIISDRLLSFASSHNNSDERTSLNSLILTAKRFHTIKVQTKDGIDLFSALNEWRNCRNRCVHSASKSRPGMPTLAVDEFLEMTKKTASDAKLLARAVCSWHRSELNRVKSVNSN